MASLRGTRLAADAPSEGDASCARLGRGRCLRGDPHPEALWAIEAEASCEHGPGSHRATADLSVWRARDQGDPWSSQRSASIPSDGELGMAPALRCEHEGCSRAAVDDQGHLDQPVPARPSRDELGPWLITQVLGCIEADRARVDVVIGGGRSRANDLLARFAVHHAVCRMRTTRVVTLSRCFVAQSNRDRDSRHDQRDPERARLDRSGHVEELCRSSEAASIRTG
jgi:hypothetical protein